MSLEVPARGTRVGWGFDAHPLDGPPPLILAGVEVSTEHGVTATSDGDVLAHAVIDALLGAVVGGDLGELFPSDDPAFENADSLFLLRQAAAVATAGGWAISHVDATVVAQEVRIAPHRADMRSNMAAALGVVVDVVSVKATTTDGLGFIGRGEGVAVVAVVSVEALA
jgi:2-C-methyl-D-erythritol 2,4-cyclodiphosphate synthase